MDFNTSEYKFILTTSTLHNKVQVLRREPLYLSTSEKAMAASRDDLPTAAGG
jgi:hypothetical protein